MNAGPALRLLALKEARALMPLWLAASLVLLIGIAAGSPRFVGYVSFQFALIEPPLRLSATLAFVVGCLALGAHSIGHDYAYRTLPVLLVQPVRRGRLLLAKAVALATGLASLTLLVSVLQYGHVVSPILSPDVTDAMLVLTPLVAISVVPWLTLVFRNAVAGVVFSLGIAAAFWISAEVVNAATHGYQTMPAGFGLNLTVLWIGTLCVSAVALVAVPWTFYRLEILDGPREIVPLRLATPHAIDHRERTRTRGPWLMLARKEIRLHDGAFLLSGLFVLVWIAIAFTGVDSVVLGSPIKGITEVFAASIALLAGAVTVAEERGHGLLSTQLLQPVAAWKQFLLKVLLAFALSLILAALLPLALEKWHPLNDQVPTKMMLALTAAAIYVSSVGTGGLWAFLWSLPFVTAGGALFSYSSVGSVLAAYRVLDIDSRSLLQNAAGLTRADFMWVDSMRGWIATAIPLGLVALLLWLAWTNYRSDEDGPVRLRRQLPWLAVAVCTGGVVTGAAWPVLIHLLATF